MRQATVSNVDSSKLNINKVLDNLPASIRDNVKYKMEMINLKDAAVRAVTDQQKIIALSNLAFFSKDNGEKNEAYGEIIRKYPQQPEAYHAYLHFLLKPDSPDAVSIARFQEFIGKCSPEMQLLMWQSGLNRLNQLKAKAEIKLEFLQPLLTREPEFKDYLNLYKTISAFAKKEQKPDMMAKAEELQNRCLQKPLYEMVMWEKMVAEEKAKTPKTEQADTTAKQKKTPAQAKPKKVAPKKPVAPPPGDSTPTGKK